MPVHNAAIAEILDRVANLLEIEGANTYRIRAYRTAARNVTSLPRSVAEMVKQREDLSRLPGIGKDLAAKIEEIVRTGSLSQLVDLERHMPPQLTELMEVAGLGAKRVGVLYQDLGISSLDELEKAAKASKIQPLPGFGAKTERRILQDVARKKSGEGKRTKLSVAEEVVQPLVASLRKANGVKQVEVAGSYRRSQETVGDLDILATSKKGANVMERFVGYEDVDRIISKGKTRSTVVLRSGLQVDLRVVPEVSYGAALHYFTGSKAHNIAIRQLGSRRGLKVNEYGVFKGKKRLAGKSEEEVYAQVALPYIDPELRENRGEIEAAREDRLPRLVTLEDIRGDLHMHTKATDGRSSLEEMARAAQERGYEYLAITDHTKHLTVARGQDARRLARQIREIDRLNEKLGKTVVLKSAEVDILEDGSLDLPYSILKELDLIVCSVHYGFGLSRKKQTERIVQAISKPYFTILGHPTGRLINQREPYDLDMERVMEAARENGCVLELTAQPDRLDLTDVHCKMAREMEVMVAISTDAHSIHEMDFMRFGVAQARRGWLEAQDVLNTRSWKELRKLLRRR